MTTPLESYPDLAKALGVPGIFFKRDDMHVYGSHKGRSIPFMIDFYWNEGKRKFALSSSGNAGIAAVLHTQKRNSHRPTWPIDLTVFVGNKINPQKFGILQNLLETHSDPHITIQKTERPLQKLFEVSKDHTIQVLRQSTDEAALMGYDSLGDELRDEDAQALFIPTSSGTTAQALYEYRVRNKLPHMEIHIVQTEAVHPMVGDTSSASDSTEDHDASASLADAIVDRVAYRRTEVQEAVRKSRGGAWIARNTDIETAIDLVRSHVGITLSPNSALAIVGIQKALAKGRTFTKPVICLITGQ